MQIFLQAVKEFLGEFGPRTIFQIRLTSRRARYIANLSLLPHEAEVILPPNSRFLVIATLDLGNGLSLITLEEKLPEDPIMKL